MGLKRDIDVVAQLPRVRNPEVNHGGFKILMSEPNLNRPNRNSGFVPASRAGLAKPMQINVLADGLILARNLDDFLLVVPPHSDLCFAPSAVRTCMQSDSFQFSLEVIVGSSLVVHKDPAVARGLLSPGL